MWLGCEIEEKRALYDDLRLMPYAMLQPCMANRKEYKVVLHNEKAAYINVQPKGKGYCWVKRTGNTCLLNEETGVTGRRSFTRTLWWTD